MIPAIQELNFPKIDGKQYATLSHATVNLADMGEKTISTQVKIDGDIVPDFSQDWEVAFQGEKYIMPLRLPQGAKENTSLNSTIDLTFQHWAIWQLKRWTFVTMQPIDTGTAVADEEVATVQLNLKDFCDLFGQVLRYYYGDTITIDLNPAWQYDNTPTAIEINHSYIWNVLIDAFHDKYGVRWAIEPREDNDNTVKGGERYEIKIGYPTTEVDHIFEYGFEGGLLKLERQVQSEEIHNMIKGRGGDTNIPFRYFKDIDPKNPDFKADPDWVEELKNIYFTNLMPATYRSYIQGWKAAHISKYPGYKAVGENNAYSPWAYRKGFTDTKFHPVEFVADEITINPQEGDRQVQIYPDYSPFVKKSSSIDVYGPLLAPLDNNDDIYPTIQGTGLDIAVDVEQILSDDVTESVESDAQVRTLDKEQSAVKKVAKTERAELIIRSRNFTVELGKTANLDEGTKNIILTKDEKKITWHSNGKWGPHVETFQVEVEKGNVTIEDASLVVVDVATGQEHSASGIPEGTYYFRLSLTIYNTANETYNATVECPNPKLTTSTLDNKWSNTFDIWVKDIWGSTRLAGETDSQYSERVWKPILGDRDKNTAKIVFTSGMLLHEDYEFTIVDFPVPDTSKTYTDTNGIRHDSHWRIKLAKSDAELEATGLYVPSTQKQGNAGDTFAFIGTEMTHVPYVVDAEIRLDDWKKDHLGEVKEIKPTFVVTTDRVRLNNEGKPDALINQLRVGNSLRIADKRFIQPIGDRAYETLYLQSLTYTYREPSSDDAALNPDVEIVLSNEYTTSANPVSVMQGEISAMQRLLGSISNVEQIVRAVGDKLYLRKDGISDISYSPTRFFSLLTSGNFRAGIVGGAGWGFFKDENGNWVLEADRVNVRQEMQVNTLVINQAEGRGGMEIDTAAFMEVTRVEETTAGYVCYFDQKDGSVANLFHVDDVAFCNRWTPENQELKFYKRRVIAVGVDNVTLTKERKEIDRPLGWSDSGVNGSGVPAEKDNIIHFGNYTDKTRQYVKVRDVVGGGYERYIENLDSVNSEGVEYYFVGKQAGESRWFVGNKDLVPYSGKGDGSYIEYINRRFNLNNVTLSVNTTIGDQSLADYIQQVSPPVKQEDIEDFVNAIMDPKLGNLQDQIDGSIMTFFEHGVPTLTNAPADGWTTDAERDKHLGDLYYDKDSGFGYRFEKADGGGYEWSLLKDSEIAKALAAAAAAQDTADGKRRIFTSQPVPPYDEGDLWVNATYPVGTTAATRAPGEGKYHRDILRCGTAKAKGGAFDISDWGLASNYTDDTKAEEALDKLKHLDYLMAALKEKTTVSGGLVLTSLISLGVNNDDFTTQTAYSGISGLYDGSKQGGGIAAWYGGDMIDKADYYDWDENLLQWVLKPGAVVDGLRIAQGVDRMDGTGYRAGGNFWWDADGTVHADPLSFFVGEDSVGNVLALFKFYPSNNRPFAGTTSVRPTRPFTELRLGTQDGTKGITLSYDEERDAIKIDGRIYATEDVTALGRIPMDGGGSGTGVAGMYYGDWTDYSEDYDSYAVSGKSGKALYNLIKNAGGGGVDASQLGSLTISRNGVTAGVYSPSKASVIDITVPTRLSELVDDKGYLGRADADSLYLKASDLIRNYPYTQGTIANVRGDGVMEVGKYIDFHDGSGDTSDYNPRLMAQGGALYINSSRILTEGNYASNLDSRYVKKSGDMMSGRLTITGGSGTGSGLVTDEINTNNLNGLLTYHPASWTGVTNQQWSVGTTDSQGVIRSSNTSLLHYRNSSGTLSTIWDSGNDGSGSGLDADMLDGLHGGDFARSYSNMWTNGETVAEWAKRAMPTPGINSMVGWAWASSANLTLGSYTIDRERYSVIDFRQGNLNNIWNQKAILFLPTYRDSSMIYIAQMTTSENAGVVTTAVKRYADYDTVLASNVASATKLQTARTLWGQSFDGTGNVSGDLILYGENTFNASSSKLYFRSRLAGNNGPYIQGISSGGYDKQRIAIFQSNTSSYNHEYFEALTIMPSGYVGINTPTPAYPLDVNGSARVTSLLISSGLVEWDAAKNAFKFNGNLYATGDITALGSSAVGGSGSSGGVDTLAQLADVTLSGLSAGHALVYDGTKWTNRSIAAAGLDLSGLAQYLSTNQYLTQPAADGRYVTLATEQTITGKKTFTSECTTVTRQMRVDGASSSFAALPHLMLHIPNVNWAKFVLKNDGTVHLLNGGATDFNSYGHLTASAFVKYGGTSSQYLMADGSVREQVYFRQNCGNIPVGYVDITNYSANAAGYANYQSGTYIVSRSGHSEILVNLALNAGSASALQFLTSYSDSAPLYFRKTIDSNRVSGPWREILYSRQIANGGDVQSMTGNGLFYTPTDGDTQTLVNAPFTGSFLMLSHTCYNQGNDVRRSRMALDGYGRMRLFNDRGTAGTGGVWYDVLTSGNYTSYVNPANFVTALGTSGNYLTWTKNGVTNNITVPYATTAARLYGETEHTGTALSNFDTGYTQTYGATSDLGDSISYSAILSVSAGNQHRYFQIIGGKGNTNFLRWRTTDANGVSLGAVRRLLDDANYASILDGRYVNITGDTMTGTLILPSVVARTAFTVSAGKVGISAGTSALYSNGLVISNPATANNTGWLRVTGTGEADTVLELATGDDGGAGEQIVVRQYNTANAVAREAKLFDLSGNTSFPGRVSASYFIANTTTLCTNLNADLLDGVQGGNYAYVGNGINFLCGTARANITTAQFVEKLYALGAFSRRYWAVKCSWSYAYNDLITDTGLGIIQLAGAVIEVFSHSTSLYTIRITTSPASTDGGVTNAVYVYRYHGDGYVPNWKRLANTSDNVASATRLRDTFSLWGQSFYGNNVSGDMTGVGKIEMNGALINRSGAIELYASTPYIDFHFGSTTTDYTSRIIESASGRLSITGKLSLGYVNDSYRLAVDSLICSSWLRTTGTAGWYSETYGGGWYMSDTTWLRIHGNKNLYASSGIIRTDGEFQIGDSGNKFRVDAQGNAWVKSIYVGGILLSHDTVNGGLKITGNAYATGDLTALGVMGGAQSITMLGVNTTNPAYNLDVNGTGRFTGLLNLSSGATHMGARVGNTYINSIDGNLVFQNVDQIRFGGDAWNYAQWAGLKYNHSAKTIYLGIADGNTFATAGTAQTGGKLSLVNCDLVVPQGYKIQLGPITIIYNATTNSIDIQGNVRYTGTLSKA